MKPEQNEMQLIYQRENELLERVWQRVQTDPPNEGNAASYLIPTPAPEQSTPETADRRWKREALARMEKLHAAAGQYQQLAKVYPSAGTLFSSLGAETLQQAKRLSTLIFLRTGVRVQPAELRQRGLPDYHGALRACILAAQAQEAECRRAAAHAPDEAFRALYQELAEAGMQQAETLRAALERTIYTNFS